MKHFDNDNFKTLPFTFSSRLKCFLPCTSSFFSKFPFFQSFLERSFTPSPFLAFRGSSTPSKFPVFWSVFPPRLQFILRLFGVFQEFFVINFFQCFPLFDLCPFSDSLRVSSHSVCWHSSTSKFFPTLNLGSVALRCFHGEISNDYIQYDIVQTFLFSTILSCLTLAVF